MTNESETQEPQLSRNMKQLKFPINSKAELVQQVAKGYTELSDIFYIMEIFGATAEDVKDIHVVIKGIIPEEAKVSRLRTKPRQRLSPGERLNQIVSILQKHGPQTRKKIAEYMEVHCDYVSEFLPVLVRGNKIKIISGTGGHASPFIYAVSV